MDFGVTRRRRLFLCASACIIAAYYYMELEKSKRKKRCLYMELEKSKRKKRCLKKAKGKKRKQWMQKIYQLREEQGHFHQLVRELGLEGERDFMNFFRMGRPQYEVLLRLVGQSITKQRTAMREPIRPPVRLAVTLRYLATGDDYNSLAYDFRIARSTISKIVSETCQAIWDQLQPKVLPKPTSSTFEEASVRFRSRFSFPNCVGSIGGRHVLIRSPSTTETFRTILTAIADANYKFVWISIDSNELDSDGGIFCDSELGTLIVDGKLDVPADQPLAPGLDNAPYIFVADETFPLCWNLMRPFCAKSLTPSKSNFNDHLSKARTIDDTIRLMSARFRVFSKPMCLQPHNIDKVVKACVCLHNFLSKDTSSSCHGPSIPEHPSEALCPKDTVKEGGSKDAKAIREAFMEYFDRTDGELSNLGLNKLTVYIDL